MFLGADHPRRRRLVPLAAVAVAVAGVAGLRPGVETGACAQGDPVVPRVDCESAGSGAGGGVPQTLERCAATTQSFRSVGVRRSGRGLRLAFSRRVDRPVRVDVFQVSSGRTVLGQRLVARFADRRGPFRWSGRARARRSVTDGVFFARFAIRDERGRPDTRRVALVRRGGRFAVRRDFARRDSCATLRSFKLERPAFGGRRNRALGISFRLARAGRVSVEVRRGGRVVRRFATRTRPAGVTHRLRLASERLRRGTYEVRLTYAGDQASLRVALFSQRV
jgi:hypothetical protein